MYGPISGFNLAPLNLKPQKPKRYVNILHKNKILSGIGTL